jgi:hypothetical protein
MYEGKPLTSVELHQITTALVNEQEKKPSRFDMVCLVVATLNLIMLLVILDAHELLGIIDTGGLLLSLVLLIPVNIFALAFHHRAIRMLFTQFLWVWISMFLAIVVSLTVPILMFGAMILAVMPLLVALVMLFGSWIVMLKNPSKHLFKRLYIGTIFAAACATVRIPTMAFFGTSAYIYAHQRVNNSVFYLTSWSNLYDAPTPRLYKCNALAINCSIAYEGNENDYVYEDRWEMEFNEATGELLIYRRNQSIRGRNFLIYTYATQKTEP